MARTPAGAELIPNPASGAPGVRIGNVFILAGVPHIAARMLEALTGKLEGGKPMVSATVSANSPESEVAALLARSPGRAPGRGDRQLSILPRRRIRRRLRHPQRG